MLCDINMPCNAYHFENGNCGLAFLNKENFYEIHGDDVNHKNVYLNGKYIFISVFLYMICIYTRGVLEDSFSNPQ